MTRLETYPTIRRLAMLVLPVLGVAACDSPTEVPAPRPPARAPVAYVEIVAPIGELTVGQTVVLGTRLLAADGAVLSRPVAWVSSDTAVATVSAGGVLSARGAGVAQVTATSEGVDASVSVSIRRQTGTVSIELDGLASDLLVGQTVAVTARVRDEDGVLLNRPVQWSSSNPAVATVSDAGVVTARAVGQAVITARADGKEAAVAIAVSAPAAIPTTLEPAAVRAGSAGFELTIRGTGFQPGAKVRWAGQERTARVISPTEARIDITAADIQHPGAAEVRVLNPGQTLGAQLFFIIEREPASHTWDLVGLETGGALPVDIGGYFQGGDVTKFVEQRVTRGVLRIDEPAYGRTQWQLTLRIVTTMRSTGVVVKDEDVLFFGTVEYNMFDGSMLLRSGLFYDVLLRTKAVANDGLVVHQTLHHTGDPQHEQAWLYRKR